MVSYTTSQPAGQGPQRIKKTDRQYIERLNYDNIQFPVTVKDYIRIEKQNEIRVNAFGHTCPCEDKQPFLIYVSKERYNNCLNLLLLSELIREHHLGKPRDDEPNVVEVCSDNEWYYYYTETNKRHYIKFKDFKKFSFKQTEHEHRKHFCMYCIHFFIWERVLENLTQNCTRRTGYQNAWWRVKNLIWELR